MSDKLWWEVKIPDSGLPLKFTETEKGWRWVDSPGTFPKIEDYVKVSTDTHAAVAEQEHTRTA